LLDQPGLNRIVDKALQNNYDLQTTAVRLRQAQLRQTESASARVPELTAGLNRTRSRSGDRITTQHSLSMNLSWELDVWGRLADADYVSATEAHTQALDYQAARDSLTARITQLWLDLCYRQKIITVEQQWLASLVDTEQVILAGYRDGLKAVADLDTARAATAQVRISLEKRRLQQVKAWRSLALLVADRDLARTLPDSLPEIAAPDIDLPAEVVGRRLDLRSAYLKISAADKKADIAYKALLPKFNLTASVSSDNSDFDRLLSGSPAWNLIGGITAPLFNRGRLKASAEIAHLTTEIRYLEYLKVLQTALNEVENYLDQEASYAHQQQEQEQALAYSRSSQVYYQSRYRDGLSTILELLSAKRQAFQSHIELLTLEQARLSNRIQLGLSLGMGV
jgi:NodT family efflux transporter outer membrane factor (OMF) lipoprotein